MENAIVIDTILLECKECIFTAKSSKGLTMHGRGKHEIECDQCNMQTKTKILLKQHKDEKHNEI